MEKGITRIVKSFLSFRKKQQPSNPLDPMMLKTCQRESWTRYDKQTDCYTIKFEDENLLEPVRCSKESGCYSRVMLDLEIMVC